MYTMPGPGDSITWGAPTGHPNDPRSDGDIECTVCGEYEVDHENMEMCDGGGINIIDDDGIDDYEY